MEAICEEFVHIMITMLFWHVEIVQRSDHLEVKYKSPSCFLVPSYFLNILYSFMISNAILHRSINYDIFHVICC